MEIVKKAEGDSVVFLVQGKIDVNTARQLEEELFGHIADEKSSFTVDMTNVTYLSSGGLRAFLGAQKKSNAAGITMTLSGVSKQIQEIFDITGFSGVLTIV